MTCFILYYATKRAALAARFVAQAREPYLIQRASDIMLWQLLQNRLLELGRTFHHIKNAVDTLFLHFDIQIIHGFGSIDLALKCSRSG